MTKKTRLLNLLIATLNGSTITSRSKSKKIDYWSHLESRFFIADINDVYVLVELSALIYDGNDTCHHGKMLMFDKNCLDYSKPIKVWNPPSEERFYHDFIDYKTFIKSWIANQEHLYLNEIKAKEEKMFEFIKNTFAM